MKQLHPLLFLILPLFFLTQLILLSHVRPAIMPDERAYLHGKEAIIAFIIHLTANNYYTFILLNFSCYLLTIFITLKYFSEAETLTAALHPAFWVWSSFAVMEPLGTLSLYLTQLTLQNKQFRLFAVLTSIIGRMQFFANLAVLLDDYRIWLLFSFIAFLIANTQIEPNAIVSVRYLLPILTIISFKNKTISKLIPFLTPILLLQQHALLHAIELCAQSTTEYCEMLRMT